MIEILNRYTRAVLYSSATAETIAQAVVEARQSGACLSRADLSGANLSGACLSRADLSGACLSRADLSGANLSGADLYGANLSGANLYEANLSRANLYGANLYGAKGLLDNGTTPLQILGTKHAVLVRKPGILQIGCMEHPVAWWLEHYKAVGRSEGYSSKQVAEYRGYIALARRWMKIHGVLEVKP